MSPHDPSQDIHADTSTQGTRSRSELSAEDREFIRHALARIQELRDTPPVSDRLANRVESEMGLNLDDEAPSEK